MQIWERKFIARIVQQNKEQKNAADVKVRFMQNDWFRKKNQIAGSYMNAFRGARREVVIVASYFIPNKRIMRLMRICAKNGVKVKVILSAKSDVPIIKGAITYLYNMLLRNNIQIFEYQKSILHAKVAIVDQQWTTIGSYNLNYLSEFFSLEMNIDVLNKDFAIKFLEELDVLIKSNCIEITKENFKKKFNLFTKFTYFIQYNISSIIIRILYILNRHDRSDKRKTLNRFS
jgi:cardiolipin synthase